MSNGKKQKKKPLTLKIAVWSAQHNLLVILLWFAVIAALVMGGLGGLGTKVKGFASNGIPSTESGKGAEVFEAAGAVFPDTMRIIFNHPTLKTTDPAYQSAVQDAAKRLGAVTYKQDGNNLPVFTTVLDYYSSKIPTLSSADGTTTMLVAPIAGSVDDAAEKYKEAKPVLSKIKEEYKDFKILVYCWASADEEYTEVISKDMDGSLVITLPLTFLILLLAFGAVAAAAVPLILAGSSLMATFGLLAIYSHIFGAVDKNASQVVVLIGLAVGVDYSLFMITRYRNERYRGRSKLQAIEIASSTAGRAVFFSGVTVMISLAGLYIVNDNTFNSIATGTILVVLVSIIGSLTFLPAALATLGKGLNWGRIPFFGRERGEETGVWGRIISRVMRHPVASMVLITSLLVAMAVPVFHLTLGNTTSDAALLPKGMEFREATFLLTEKWPQGTALKLDVIVKSEQANRADIKEALDKFSLAALQIKGLSGPVEITPAPNGKVIRVSYYMSGTASDQINKDIVAKVRNELVPTYLKPLSGTEIYVAGFAAVVVDTVQHYTEVLPWVFAFVLSLSFLLLLVAFHSIVIPIKAIILNLLSTGAAYGAVVLVFQDGWFSQQLDFKAGGVIESFIPMFLFTILFGLSMDYHLFVLTRIKEEKDKGASSTEAVVHAIGVTSGTITSAALIMVVVFATFVTLRLMVIRQLGLGLAVAVFVDATVIRCILLPATMKMLGDWNWYLPKFLRWLPTVNIEGETEPESLPEKEKEYAAA